MSRERPELGKLEQDEQGTEAQPDIKEWRKYAQERMYGAEGDAPCIGPRVSPCKTNRVID